MVGVLVSMFPFYWTIVMATNTSQDISKYPPKLTFGSHLFENIDRLLNSIDFFGSMLNTVIVAVSTTLLVVFLDSLAAFAFAKYEFPGRRLLFGMLLGIFMLPLQLAIIPQYLIMAELGWLGSLKAVVLPATANAFGIFWMRQYMIGAIHDELLDAARMDGCGFFRQYWHVGLPTVRPGLAFLAIYAFVTSWNDYVWPLVALVNPDQVTLQVALSQLNVSHGRQDYAMVMAGVLLAVLPLVLVFSLFARSFIADASKGAVRE
ncbi:carbohydrate ABC transporter permease [Streptomyces sporangiiformans]|uniref:Carbohydrate ABC transporter permease n=1 Tax=Streptomyces sporangiiformans TaxID=2315329 RepID=A0A505DB21_9ACTN|nr:carbohydrate ABC transporter permease [Streptomyces sporangiiformans]TPQ17818.1 carbohydrate ABC transporter permease [Streptomyces sporangiiformans]